MLSSTLRTLWKRPERLRTLMARLVVESVRRVASVRGMRRVVRGAVKDAARVADVGGAMAGTGIVEAAR